jgi:hypothetical protein
MAALSHAIEVLVKKASVDPEFRRLLLEKRGEAARAIDLELTDAERDILSSVPAGQLEKIIDSTKVEPEHRKAFLSNVGKAMLAAAVVGIASGCPLVQIGSAGISPDEIRRRQTLTSADANDPNATGPGQTDIDPDEQERPGSPGSGWSGVSRGIRPD